MLLRILLLLAPSGIFAQPVGDNGASHIAKADSLRLIGYYSQEVKVRQQIQKVSGSEAAKNYNIARINSLLDNFALPKARAAFERLALREPVTDFWMFRLKCRLLYAEEKYSQAIELLESYRPENELYQAILRLDAGQNYLETGDWAKAIGSLTRASGLFQRLGMRNHYLHALVLNDLGFAHDEAGIHNKILEHYDEALRIFMSYYSGDFRRIATINNNILYSYIEYGDQKKAAEIQMGFEKYMEDFISDKYAKKYRQYSVEEHLNAISMYLLNNCRYYSFAFDASRIHESISRMEELFRRAPSGWKEKNYGLLRSAYDSGQYGLRKNGDFEASENYSRLMADKPTNDFYRMKMYANIALNRYDRKNYEKALFYTKKSLGSYSFEKRGMSYNTLMVLKAELLANLGRFEESTMELNQLYLRILGAEKGRVRFTELNEKHFPDQNSGLFINVLIHSGHVFRLQYERNGQREEAFRTSKNFYRLAGEVFRRYYLSGLYNNQLGEYLDDIKEGLFYPGSKMAPQQLEQDIELLEQISSAHLWKKFLSKYAENINMPKGLIDRKNFLQIRLSTLSRMGGDQEAIRQTRKELENLQGEWQKKSNSYMKFDAGLFSLEDVSNSLDEDQVICKYTVTDSSVYVHLISGKEIKIKRLGSQKIIRRLCKDYLEKLKAIDSRHRGVAQQLYACLVAPLSLEKNRRLVIIPENFLCYLPFESLFWVKEAAIPGISYCYSLKLINQVSKMPSSFDYDLIAFAPDYPDSDKNDRQASGRLAFSESEIENIRLSVSHLKTYEKDRAAKNEFLRSLGRSSIHHLAMHANMDTSDYEQSHLVFMNNEKVFFYELYALNFPSEMVVLSACNTGIGVFQSGEGLMSISKALNYAGVKTSVYGLWKIPDKETAALMFFFYNNLKKGMPKDLALSQAKADFISGNPLFSHPFYWAGMVLNGDSEAVRFRDNRRYFLLVIALLILTVLLYLVFSQRRKLPKLF